MPERYVERYSVYQSSGNDQLTLLIQGNKDQGSTQSSSSEAATQTNAELEWWIRPLGACFLVVACAAAITVGSAIGAFKCVVSTLVALQFSDSHLSWTYSEVVVKLTMQAAVWFEAILLLAAATATLAWNAVVLLHPLLSGGNPTRHNKIAAQPLSDRLAHVTKRTGTVVAALVCVVLMMWYVLYGYDFLQPASSAAVTLLVVIVVMSSTVLFSMACGGFTLSKAALLSVTARGSEDAVFEYLPAESMHDTKHYAEWHVTAHGDPVLVGSPAVSHRPAAAPVRRTSSEPGSSDAVQYVVLDDAPN